MENACSNPECLVEQGAEDFAPLRTFNVRIDLSDHTGSLKNCRLSPEAAEAVLGCSVCTANNVLKIQITNHCFRHYILIFPQVSQFDSLTDEQKTMLKWNFLFERCAARILVLKASHERRQPYISIVSCTVADLSEVFSRLPLL